MQILDILGIACPILARILIPLSINLDCRAKNLASRKLFTILSFFFPIIMGIIYAIRRKSLQKAFKVCSKCGSKADPYATNCPKCGGYMLLEYKNPKEKMLKTISIVLCVVGVLSYCVGQFIGAPSYIDEIKHKLYAVTGVEEGEPELEDEEEFFNASGLWYDKKGIAYSDYRDLKLYDENGNVYTLEFDEVDAFDIVGVIDENGNKYEYEKSFIDENGYFCYDIDTSSGTYYHIDEVNWDYSGQLQ